VEARIGRGFCGATFGWARSHRPIHGGGCGGCQPGGERFASGKAVGPCNGPVLAALAGRFPSDEPAQRFRSRPISTLPLWHPDSACPSALVRSGGRAVGGSHKLALPSAELGVATANLFPRSPLTGHRGGTIIPCSISYRQRQHVPGPWREPDTDSSSRVHAAPSEARRGGRPWKCIRRHSKLWVAGGFQNVADSLTDFAARLPDAGDRPI